MVTHVEAIPIRLPLRREWSWRGLAGGLGRWVIVRIHTDDGLAGLGEATPLPDWGGDFNRQAGETQTTVVHVVRDLLAPLLIGSDPFDIEATLVRMDAAVRGHQYAKAAVDIALHDLQGKITGQPLFRLLGGRFRDGVVIAHMIGLMSQADAVVEARGAVEDGCTAFQIKGGGDVERDVSVVAAVRAEVGSGVVLRLDANQGYRELGAKAAVRAVRRLVEAGIDLIEQPSEGLAALAYVRQHVDVEMIVDESVWGVTDVLDIARARAADALSLYIAKAGGLARAGRLAVLADAFGYPCDVNGSLESGVGTAASLHFATAHPAVKLPAVIPASAPAGQGAARTAGRYYADDVVTEALSWAHGKLYAPAGPGLGVQIDEEKLAAYRVDGRG